MKEGDENTLPGSLIGTFTYKKRPDGSVDKNKVICNVCSKEFAYHRSSSTLKYHINAKHPGVNVNLEARPSTSRDTNSSSQRHLQTTLDQTLKCKLSKSVCDRLSNSLAKWIAMSCRPVSVIEDRGLAEVLQIASSDVTYNPPSRNTIMLKIQQLYDTEKKTKGDVLVGAEYIALTGDHWTSVSNHNYLGVTAHIIDCKWKLHSFALAMLKTDTRHYADACAQQFLSVAEAWGVQQKITTVGTDSARNMIAAARKLPYEHMPCVAHMLQRSITVFLADSGFCDTLAKCRKIVGHFKHSPANTEELHQQQNQLGQLTESLIQDVPTRWNSSLAMISRLLKNQEAIKATLSRQKHKLTMLTTSEWDKLQRLETILEPCR